jgi:hydrogenase expression/formation protein HypC
MCVGIPMKLTAIDGNLGVVEEAGVQREVGLDLLEDPQIGHYVIVHAGYAIELLDPEEAKITLDLLRQVHILEDDVSEDAGEP